MDIFYLSVDDVIQIHKDLTGIERGLLRRDLLELAKNHPFVDGNKRAAWGAARIFLWVNGIEITASAEEVVAFMLYVVGPSSAQDGLVDFLYAHMTMCDGETLASPGNARRLDNLP